MLRTWTTYTQPKALANGVVRELPLAAHAKAAAVHKSISEWTKYANLRDAIAFDNLNADVWDDFGAQLLSCDSSGNDILGNTKVFRDKSPRFDRTYYRYTGPVDQCRNWYTSVQGKYRNSRAARRRKGGWKGKPLAQRHDAPD